MKIIDTVPYFLNNYEPSISSLRKYYAEYPNIFADYFARHCKDTDERHGESIKKYPQHFSAIKQVYKNIVPIIEEVAAEYEKLYQITFPIEINLLVGGFGSNAYTNHQIIPDITFALEKLSPEYNHLRVIVAHEFGHAAQNIISNSEGMEWPKVDWTNALLSLYREGVSTYLSSQIVSNVHLSIYFSYNDEGYDWLAFANANTTDIKKAFAENSLALKPDDLIHEWFSINGGKKFGYSRLAYFIGYLFFQYELKKFGEMATIVAWKEENFVERVEQWLFHGE